MIRLLGSDEAWKVDVVRVGPCGMPWGLHLALAPSVVVSL